MANTSDWLTGQHLIDCIFTPFVLGSGGVLTPAAASNIVAVVDRVVPELTAETEDVRAINDPQMNEVVHSWGFGLRATIILRGSTRNYLNWLIMNYRYCGVSWRAGAERHVSYHCIKGWTGGVTGRAKNTEDVTLGPIKVVGVSQYTVQNA